MPVRQSAECGRLRNSAAELKPNPNFIPDFKPPPLTLTPFTSSQLYIVNNDRLYIQWLSTFQFVSSAICNAWLLIKIND